MAPSEPANLETNGAAIKPATSRSPLFKRRLVLGGVVLFVAAWTVAIIYSVTVGGRSPERLEAASATTVEAVCRDTQHDLSALTQLGTKPTVAERAARVASEDRVFLAMIRRLRAVQPEKKTPATALTAWVDDWQKLVVAREHFVAELGTSGDDARFVEPATKGVEPIADKMNDWILEQGTRTESCNTGVLQVEVVEGPRTYGAESES